ncbi:hypothetical protein LI90_1075 [Carbonactinospora thermoautotrophica]|uniref:Uncharacterized protein n=1 Tax=Carbonactinospora thermoautotrophica TaxID=1469144 RepID=A0A132MNJ9_9ACTN|nr:hypothetical protein LI90_1075 [Carbonactinospora thermoautotrophica]
MVACLIVRTEQPGSRPVPAVHLLVLVRAAGNISATTRYAVGNDVWRR